AAVVRAMRSLAQVAGVTEHGTGLGERTRRVVEATRHAVDDAEVVEHARGTARVADLATQGMRAFEERTRFAEPPLASARFAEVVEDAPFERGIVLAPRHAEGSLERRRGAPEVTALHRQQAKAVGALRAAAQRA